MTNKHRRDYELAVNLAGAPAPCAAQSALAWQMTREVFARKKHPAIQRKKREKETQRQVADIVVTET